MDISVWQNGAMQLSVGAAIKARRKARGWNQEALGQAAGVNTETVNRAEMGANVTVDTLLKITRALGVELEITLRDPQGHAQTVRDVLPNMTPAVSAPGDPALAPGEDIVLSSLPSSPSHIALYGIIGELEPDQARTIRRPLLDLIDHIQPPPEVAEKPARPGKKSSR